MPIGIWITTVGFLALYCFLLRHRNARLAEGVKALLYLCKEAADFRNANTHQGIDEGEVVAGQMIQRVMQRTGIYDYK